jgi:hypothetical protein
MLNDSKPVTLREHAIIALENRTEDRTENIAKKSGSVFREVYVFTVNDESFVVKIDKQPNLEYNGCKEELEKWEELKDDPIGKILCPVLAHGKYNDRYFTVQPKLESYLDILDIKNEYLHGGQKLFDEVIFPAASLVYPKLDKYGMVPGIIGDMHYANWGRDSDGNWLCFDYSYDSYDD